jgi:hypothetical protein
MNALVRLKKNIILRFQKIHDYLYLYNNVYIKKILGKLTATNKLYTNERLIYNTAVRNWYLKNKNLDIDENWIIGNINQFGYSVFNYTFKQISYYH